MPADVLDPPGRGYDGRSAGLCTAYWLATQSGGVPLQRVATPFGARQGLSQVDHSVRKAPGERPYMGLKAFENEDSLS